MRLYKALVVLVVAAATMLGGASVAQAKKVTVIDQEVKYEIFKKARVKVKVKVFKKDKGRKTVITAIRLRSNNNRVWGGWAELNLQNPSYEGEGDARLTLRRKGKWVPIEGFVCDGPCRLSTSLLVGLSHNWLDNPIISSYKEL